MFHIGLGRLNRKVQAVGSDTEVLGKIDIIGSKQYNGPRKLDKRLRWKSRPC
jgi:hypothetical protein